MYGLEHAGIGRYLIHLTEELKKLRTEGPKNIRTEFFFIILLRKKYFDSLKFPDNWQKVLADFRHYSFREQIKLSKILLEQKPDLVHFPHFNIPLFWKGKFVVTIHDMTMHKQGIDATNLPLPFYLLKRIPYKILFRKAVKNAVKIITPTESVKREILDYFKRNEDKVASIYEGVDDKFKKEVGVGENEVLKKYNLQSQRYFIYAGNTYPHKNIPRAIEATVRLNKKCDKYTALCSIVSFAVVSSRNIFTERIEKFVKKEKAEKQVRFLGFVPDEELIVLLKSSLAFVYPSLSEGFGLQGLEAMAAGTLLLASDIPVFKEVYKDNAIYFNSHNSSSIAKVMKDALEMKRTERARRIKKAQEFSKRYSWTKMVKETLEVYKGVLS
jgi:glycosyltransferase involved in cell wall biosynthesis